MECKRKRIWFMLICLYTVILFILNFVRIFDNSFWCDETYTIMLSKMNLFEMFNATAADVHPPLYYILTMIGFRLLGSYGWVYHLISLVPYAIVLFVSITFVRKKYGILAAIMTITCSSLMSCALTYNVEVRMYSWAAMFLFLSYLSFHRILENHDNKDYIFFTLFSLATAYTHYYALIAVAFLYVALICEAVIRKKHVVKSIITCVTTVVLYLPWFFVLLRSFNRTKENFWLSTCPTLRECLRFIFAVCNTHINGLLIMCFFLTISIVLIKNLKSKIQRGGSQPQFTIWIVSGLLSMFGTIFVGIAISKVVRPMFLTRYLFPVALIAWLIWGATIEKLRYKKAITAVIISIIFAGSIPNYLQVIKEEKYQNDLCQRTVEKINEILDNEILITNGEYLNLTILDYYFPQNAHKLTNEKSFMSLDENKSYLLVITHEIDDRYINWIKSSGMTYSEVCQNGIIGSTSVNVYKITGIGY